MNRSNEGDKPHRVRNLLRQWKTNVICLPEFKLAFMSSSVVLCVVCKGVSSWIGVILLRGASGGIFAYLG